MKQKVADTPNAERRDKRKGLGGGGGNALLKSRKRLAEAQKSL